MSTVSDVAEESNETSGSAKLTGNQKDEEDSGKSNGASSPTETGKSACSTTQALCIGSLTFSGVLAAGSYWLWGRMKNKEVNWWESPKVIMAGIATAVVSAGACLWSYFSTDDNDEDKDESTSLSVQPKKSSRKKRKRRKDKTPDEGFCGFSDLTIVIVAGILVTVGGFLIGLCVVGMRTKDFPHVVHEGDELV